jgi:hypothetical protein
MNLYTSYAPPACIQDATHTKSEAKVRRVRCTTEEPAGMGLNDDRDVAPLSKRKMIRKRSSKSERKPIGTRAFRRLGACRNAE